MTPDTLERDQGTMEMRQGGGGGVVGGGGAGGGGGSRVTSTSWKEVEGRAMEKVGI